ncbi:putative cyclin d [Corchorus olitorius]|uniref:Cyclin d n=1 Tax=Corchorus olitorius TaxID=93759 RepID=A0A1R3L3U5_9ROSI|nr:putative cyclin d [Corchorus olitorius]
MVGSGSDCYCSYVHCKDDFDGLRPLTDIGMESSEMIMGIVLGALHSELVYLQYWWRNFVAFSVPQKETQKSVLGGYRLFFEQIKAEVRSVLLLVKIGYPGRATCLCVFDYGLT